MLNWLRRRTRFERPVVEALEPRILYSAGLAPAVATEAAAATEMRVVDAEGNFVTPGATAAALPLAFEQNVGQAAAGIDYLAHGNGYAVGLDGGNATLVLGSGDAEAALRLRLAGANAPSSVSGEDPLAARTNYLRGDADQWLTGIANVGSVTYADVYDGIDVRYYGHDRALEYDFTVGPGADAHAIALTFEGTRSITLDAAGDLLLGLDNGADVRFLAPVAYQDGANGREAVTSRYIVGGDGTVRFELGAYDATRALVIDPVLAYGTYFGGTGAESASAVAVDGSGYVYMTGHTASGGLLGTLLGLRGGDDIYVTKMSADLSTVVFTSYLGGLGNERANGIAVDGAGHAYLTGWTTSSSGLGGFPTVGAIQGSLSGSQDAFVMELAANGASLVYSTYLGGSGNADVGNGIAVDASGNAYVVGTTTSANFPLTVSAADATLAGEEAFVTRISAGGTAIDYSTFFGGSGNDRGTAIALEAGGKVDITGSSDSADLPVSSGALQGALAGGYDAFVARLNPSSNNFTHVTYLGGSADDGSTSIALRSDGSVVLGGATLSGNLAVTAGACQSTASSGGDGFVAVLGSNLKSASFLSYLGGSGGGEAVTGVAVDASNRVFAVGYTSSSSFPLTADAANGSQSGSSDGFIALVDSAKSGNAALLYSTLIGANGADTLNSVAFANGRAYAAGNTTSSSGIATGGSAQTSHGGSTDAFAMALLVSGNSAPILAGANALGTILEDPASNAGTLVSALMSGKVTDADAGALSGIAVTAVDNTHGTWQYSTSGGTAWSAFGAVSASSARLLAADAGTLVRFTPAADWNGSVASGLTFRAWDQTTGTAGATADTTTSGGTSAFSTATASAAITVTSVNDAPAGTANTVITHEDSPYTFAAADFGFGDTHDSPVNAFSGVKIATLGGAGSLTDNGLAVVAGQFVSAADIAGGLLRFTPAANASGAGYASFTFQVRDDGGTANGGIDLDPVARSMTVNVTAINDAPTLTLPPAQDGTSNTPVLFGVGTGNAIVVADADALAAPVAFTLSAANGTLTLSGTAGLIFTTGTGSADASMSFTGSLASLNDALDGLRFDPTPGYSGSTGITLGVNDQGNAGSGGAKSASGTVIINVSHVNSAPVLAGANTMSGILEDASGNAGTLVSDLIAGQVGDVDTGALAGIAVVAVDDSQGTWQFSTDAGAHWSAFGGVSESNARLLASDTSSYVRFAPVANWNGSVAGGLAFRAWDQTSGAAGGTAAIGTSGGSSAFSAARFDTGIAVSAVNDAPAGVNRGVAVLEDTAYVFSNADFVLTDASDTPVNALDAVRITSLPGAGTLSVNGSGAVAGQVVAAADIAAGRMVFTPAANASGTGYASFTFQVRDDGGTANGGANLDPVARRFTVDVTAVNDAPGGADRTVSASEDTAYAFTTSDFGFTDGTDTPANQLAAVRIASLPGAGALRLNGSTVAAGQSIAVADIAAGHLVFTAAANANGAAYASFSFQVRDDGGTANGGIDLDAVTHTLTVDVAPVDDAPSGADRTVTMLEDSSHVFVAADFGFSDGLDTPANAFAAVRVSSLPQAGSLTDNGVAVVAGQYVGAADITAGHLVYAPAANANGALYASFTFQVRDDGIGTGGGVDLDPVARTLTLAVTPVNDTPAGLDSSATLDAGGNHVFSLADFRFSDPTDPAPNALAAVRVASLPGSGTLTLAGTAVTAGQWVDAADIAAGRLRIDAATSGAGIGFSVRDDGGTAHGVIDTETTTHTMTLTQAAAAPAAPVVVMVGSETTQSVTVAAQESASATSQAQPPSTAAASSTSTSSTASARGAAAGTTANADAMGAVGDAFATPGPLLAGMPAANETLMAVPGAAVGQFAGAQPETRSVPTVSAERRGDGADGGAANIGETLTASATPAVARLAELSERVGTALRSPAFEEAVAESRRQIEDMPDLRNTVAATAGGATLGISFAYALWLVRGGVLMGSMLSALPAWRVLDPLPVLARHGEDADTDDDDSPFGDEPAGGDDDPARVLKET